VNCPTEILDTTSFSANGIESPTGYAVSRFP
jgi:hypothetical protein